MIGWFVRCTLFTLALLTGLVAVIRAQPYDDPELRTLFESEGCSGPCLMSIQPGVTTIDDAEKLLEQHEWVGNIEPYYIADGSTSSGVRGWLFWDWNNRAPGWLKATSNAAFDHAGALSTLDGIVDAVVLATRIPFGRLRILYGEPDGYSLSLRNLIMKRGVFSSATMYYQHIYLQGNVEIEANMPCRQLATLWFNPAAVTVFSPARTAAVMRNFFRDRPFLEQAMFTQRLLCT